VVHATHAILALIGLCGSLHDSRWDSAASRRSRRKSDKDDIEWVWRLADWARIRAEI
jgi:hypothetical protein